MAAKVVDASSIAALLFNEPEAEIIALHVAGHRLWASLLFLYELANVCWKKLRRAPQDAQIIVSAFQNRAELNIGERPVDADEVLAIARTSGLTAYDASYLWLSKMMGIELVTIDRKLARAAALRQE